jgi:hypothetical protein
VSWPTPWTNQVVSVVIISGSTGQEGIFVYNPSPAFDNLLISISPVSGTDAYGNFYHAGIDIGAAGSSEAEIILNAGVMSILDAEGNEWDLFGQEYGGVPYLVLSTPGSGNGQIYFNENGYIVPNNPQTPNTPETWHTLALASGWTAVNGPYYRYTIDNCVEFFGSATHAAFTGSTTLSAADLPSGYIPTTTWNGGGTGIPGRAGFEVNTSGAVVAIPNGTSCTECDLAGKIPLGL